MPIKERLTKTPSPNHRKWCHRLLEFLDEFTTLAWYLLADSDLVEVVLLRSLVEVQKNTTAPNDVTAAYSELQRTIIREAIEVLAEVSQQEGKTDWWPRPACDVPDTARLTLVLRLIIRCPETEVGDYLRVTSADVEGLMFDAIAAVNDSGMTA